VSTEFTNLNVNSEPESVVNTIGSELCNQEMNHNASKATEDKSFIVMAELPKPRDHSVDLCVLETKENELNSSNIDETENESTVSSSYVNNQTIETNSQNQTTYMTSRTGLNRINF
jgi:hypothetical protein